MYVEKLCAISTRQSYLDVNIVYCQIELS